MARKKLQQEQSQQEATDQPTGAQAEGTQAVQNPTDQAKEKKPKLQRIKFVGDGEPKRNVRIGMLTIEMPNDEEQRKGFETEHAKLIVTNLRGYKFLNSLSKN